MLANVGQKYPPERIFRLRCAYGEQACLKIQTHRSRDLISFFSILLEEHHVPPGRCAKMAGVVVGISRPRESVIRHLIPFFARDFASFAADANTRVGEETNLDVIFYEGVSALIGALNSFADHNASLSNGRLVLVTSREFSTCSARRRLFRMQIGWATPRHVSGEPSLEGGTARQSAR